MKQKVLIVFGTRPEAIKIAPLIKEYEKHKNRYKIFVCVTGQHREMLDQVLQVFDIRPNYDLQIMKHGQDLYDITSRVLMGMRTILEKIKPQLVLVHGDTTTSTAAALASFYQQIPIGHIEAGLRTHDVYSPWPEEMNRQITGRLATYHFAPTERSKQNLLRENVPENKIFVTGNTVIDALKLIVKRIESSSYIKRQLNIDIKRNGYDVLRLDSNSRRMVLITGHRRENFGDGFDSICKALQFLSNKYHDVDFVYPMHLNPNVREPISKIFGRDKNSNIAFIEPLSYLPFVYLMARSYFVLTDSGGIQEEAPGLGKPVLVMRDTTERPEAIDAGTAQLVGTDYDSIINKVSILLNDRKIYDSMSSAQNPFGDGYACKRIIEALR